MRLFHRSLNFTLDLTSIGALPAITDFSVHALLASNIHFYISDHLLQDIHDSKAVYSSKIDSYRADFIAKQKELQVLEERISVIENEDLAKLDNTMKRVFSAQVTLEHAKHQIERLQTIIDAVNEKISALNWLVHECVLTALSLSFPCLACACCLHAFLSSSSLFGWKSSCTASLSSLLMILFLFLCLFVLCLFLCCCLLYGLFRNEKWKAVGYWLELAALYASKNVALGALDASITTLRELEKILGQVGVIVLVFCGVFYHWFDLFACAFFLLFPFSS